MPLALVHGLITRVRRNNPFIESELQKNKRARRAQNRLGKMSWGAVERRLLMIFHDIELADRWLRRYQWEIPLWGFCVILIVSTLGGWLTASNHAWGLASGFFLLAIVTGHAALSWTRAKYPPALFGVTRFLSPEDPRLATLVVDELVAGIRDHVPEPWFRVKEISAVVGRKDLRSAHLLRRRLRCGFLIFGSIRNSPSGPLVHTRLLVSDSGPSVHVDRHTRENFSLKMQDRPVVYRLIPALQTDEPHEYSFEMTRQEIAALLVSIKAEIAWLTGNHETAEELFCDALSRVNTRSSAICDHIRVRLARAIFSQDRTWDAVLILLDRARDPEAFSGLTHDAATMLMDAASPRFRQSEPLNPAVAKEARSLLKRVSEDRSSPYRDQATYNLAQLLREDESTNYESYKLLVQLAKTPPRKGGSRHYSRAWYVRMQIGSYHWHWAQERSRVGDSRAAKAHFRRCASWYAQAMRRRRIQMRQRSAILHANTLDAHVQARHRIRAKYQSWILKRHRNHLLKKGRAAMVAEQWISAYWFFEWGTIGKPDEVEGLFKMLAAMAIWQEGERDYARKLMAAAEMELKANVPIVDLMAAVQEKEQWRLPFGIPRYEPKKQ